MLVDLKLFTVSLWVLVLCDQEVESIPTFTGVMANMTHMMNMTNMMNITNMMNVTHMMNMVNMTNMSNMTDNRGYDGNRTGEQRTGYSCETNDWDGPQYCKCRKGQRISKLYSRHDNRKEDRQWTLTCRDITPPVIAGHTSWRTGYTGYLNGWDASFRWNGQSQNAYMVGMRSYHNNHREDRRYAVYYSFSVDWMLTACGGWDYLNTWDGVVNHPLGPTQVIAGLYSYHSNSKEDRRFAIVVCDLVPKCDQLVSIRYGKMTTSESVVTAGRGTYDNRRSTSQNSVRASISWSEQTRLADTYTFSRRSGHSNTGSLSVTAGYNWGVIAAGGSVSVTAGFSSTFETSETWTRSQTKTYVETHSGGVEFTANCKAGCYCRLFIKTTLGKAYIPYTMITKSKGGSDRCEEKGVLTIGKAWNAYAQSVDQC